MDINDPTEVATICDEVTAQWGGGMDLKTYTVQSKFLKGTGQRPPGLVPNSYESDNSNTNKRLSNKRMSTMAKHSTKESEDSTNGSTGENDGSGSEANNQPGTNPGEPGGPIESADPEGKGLAPEAAKVAKMGPKKGRKRRNWQGKKKSVPLIVHSDGSDEEDNADVDTVVRVLHYHYFISHPLMGHEGLPHCSIRWW
jgi:hypothetical protein